MKYTLTLTTCLLFLLGQLHAQYSETFDVPNKGILAGPCTNNNPTSCTSNDFAGVDWTLEGNLSGLTAADDNFYTVGGGLRAMDIDEEICWLSPVLNMTGTASFSMDLTWLAFDDYTSPPQAIGSQDYIDVSYRIDGGSWVALPNAVGGGPRTISYATTPTASNVNGSINDLGASGLTGSTLQIRVCVDVNASTEIVTIDNVSATNATTGMAGPVCDLDLVGISSTNEDCPGANDGSITVNATTSNGPITYTLSGPVNTSNQTGVFTDLPPGSYTINLQDGSFPPGMCTESGMANIATGVDNTEPTATPPGPVTVDCPADIPAPDPSLVTSVDDNCMIPCVTEPWINEFHYDNIGEDVNEFIEIAGPAGIDLSLYELYTYDGSFGMVDQIYTLSGIIPDQDNGFGTSFVLTPMIQNQTEGIALVKNGTEVIEFISYEGVVTATDGPAMGMTSVDVGVSESTMSTPEDGSLGRIGNGNKPDDFTWAVLTQTQGNLNTGQTIANCPDNEPTVAHFGDTNNGGSGSSADPYIVTRTYRVTDAYGNFTNIIQTLTANNCCTAPTVSVTAAASPICPGETASFNLTGTPNATVTYNINGSGSQMLTLDVNGMATVEVPNAASSQTLNLISVDLNSCPQSLSESATVVVEDNEDPTITCPGPIEVTCLEDIPPVDINLPIVGDNCQGPLTVTHEGDVLQAASAFLFTSAGATGHLGPNQAMLDMAYASTNLSGNVTSVDGIQYWEVPSTGTYQIEALGGQGYGPFGGRGAYISGEFNLQAGDMLKILVGQAAGPYLDFPSTTYNRQYGGGGGSFVTTSTNTPLVVAGGGGGSHRSEYNPLCDAQTGTAGAAGSFGSLIGAGGTNGQGGQQASSADGGGGLLGNGDGIAGGFAFVNGGRGGIDEGTGGFGGGGGTSSWNNYRGGGGGGYSGGGGSNNGAVCCPSGGGGGSYNDGSNQMGLAGMGLGDGQVKITTLSAAGSVLRTYRVTDASGNFAECTQTIVVNDMTPPTAICPSTAPTVVLDGSGNGTLAENALAGGNSTDNCAAGVTETSPLTNFTCANAPSAMVVLTAIDAAGNMHTVNCTVNIVDGEDPVAICPTTAPTVILDGSGNGTLAENALAGGNSTDNCSVTETSPLTNFTCANSPSAMVVLTATDAAGNMHTANCTVNIVDDEDPVAICPTTAPTVILDGNGNGTLAENALAGGNSTDNCSVTETSPLTNFTCANTPSAMVVLTATDAAGNMHTANCTVNIVDDEDPTTSCNNITVQLDANRTASITAADIDGGSTDNCGSVSLSISGATTFDCDDVGTPQVATLTVTDGSNNSSECDAMVTVADDDNPCTTIFGNIVWEHDRIANPIGVPDASVALTGDDTGSDNTDMSGDYAIPTAGGNLTLTPTKTTGDPYEGVTAADVTRIQQHVTFIDQLDDGYKVIAADVNQSNSVTGLDAAVVFHAINGNPAAQAIFEAPSWRFVDAAHTFGDENAPWPFPDSITLMNVMADVLDQDFIGAKIGDVNGTWAGSTPLTSPSLSLMAQDPLLKAGQRIRVAFRANALPDVAAWQFALRFDTDYLRFERALPTAAFPLKDENFGAWQAEAGELRSVFAVPQGLALPKDEVIFELQFQALRSGLHLSEVMQLAEEVLPSRVYDTALRGGAVALAFERDAKMPNLELPGEAALGFALEQNIPNPFSGETLVRFQLPEAGEAVFSVHDVQGRLLYEQRGFFDAGLHEIQLDAARLGTTGVLSYTLQCGAQSATRRMVLVR